MLRPHEGATPALLIPCQLLLLFLLLPACGERDPEGRLEVEFAGCAEILAPRDRPTCVLELSDPGLRLWARGEPGAELAVVAGAVVRGEPEAVQGGVLFAVEALPGAPALRLQAERGEGPEGAYGRAAFTLPLAWRSEEPYWKDLARDVNGPDAERARSTARRDLQRALGGAEEVPPEPGARRPAPPPDRGRTLRWLAELESDRPRAASLFGEAAEHFRREGRLGSQLDALTRRHLVLWSELGDDEGAQAVLDGLPPSPSGDASSALLTSLYRASWDLRFGRLRSALRELRDARLRAQRLRDPWQVFVRQTQVVLASRLGLYGEALEAQAWLRRHVSDLPERCQQADLLADLGWSGLLMLEGGFPADPVPDLEGAVALAVGCSSERRAVAATNLALAYLQAGRPARAREVFAAAVAGISRPPGWLRLWRYVVEGRVALAEGRGRDALVRFRELERVSGEALRPDLRWQAFLGQARALEDLGRPAEALEAYARGEALLDGRELAAPFPESPEPAAAYGFFQRGTREHLDLLLRREEAGEALALARRSRRRALERWARETRLEGLRGEQAAGWARLQRRYGELRREVDALAERARELPLDEARNLSARRDRSLEDLDQLLDQALLLLGSPDPAAEGDSRPPPAPGEVTLLYHPLPEGWIGFALSAAGVEARRIPPLEVPRGSPATLSRYFLEPFAAALESARRVRILPFGALWAVDFHALPFGGGPLFERAPVVYALDLRPREPEPLPDRPEALLVEDPTRSLARAAEEVRAVASGLARRSGWKVERAPHRPEQAPTQAAWLLQALEAEGLELLHFAGHGGGGGDPGLHRGLALAGGTYLTASDILTRRRVPRTVVLSACSVIATAGSGAPVGLGTGQAFLLAGSREVVGPVEAVEDSAAAALMEAFYRHWPAADAASALRLAFLELGPEGGLGPWVRFRVLER